MTKSHPKIIYCSRSVLCLLNFVKVSKSALLSHRNHILNSSHQQKIEPQRVNAELELVTSPNVSALKIDDKTTAARQSLQAATYKGQEKMSESMEMPEPSYFTVRLLSEQPSLCSTPASLFIFLLTLLLLIIPLSPHASADGWAHLLQISFESNRDSVVALLLPQWTQIIETSAHECYRYTRKKHTGNMFQCIYVKEKLYENGLWKWFLCCVFHQDPGVKQTQNTVSIAFVLTAPQRAESNNVTM